MAQHSVTKTLQDHLTLYVLGLLDPEAAAATDAYIRAQGLWAAQELQAIEQVADLLGYSVTATQPRPELRQRLLDRIATTSEGSCSAEGIHRHD